MSKHTPEPWEVWKHETILPSGSKVRSISVDQKIAEGKSDIAKCWYNSNGLSLEESAANATRIVACVNACAGIDDPSVIPDMRLALKRVCEQLREYDPDNAQLIIGWSTLARAEGRK
jgi:hypothetical protein